MQSRKHFHTFEALRFFACFSIFIAHLPFTTNAYTKIIKGIGSSGLLFFFILSGFLITYILLVDKVNNQFSLKTFFGNRMLRILPLYYGMILFAFIMSYLLEFLSIPTSDEGYQPNWILSLLFLENYQMILKNDFPDGAPLRVMWSLCIELHFYIIWAILFNFLSLKNIKRMLLVAIVIGFISRIIYHYLEIPTLDIITHLDLVAYGSLVAYFLITKEDVFLQLIAKISFTQQLIFLVFTIILVIYFGQSSTPHSEIYTTPLTAICLTILLAFTLPLETQFKIKDKNIFSKLGVYTYGFYLFQTIVIGVLLTLFNYLGLSLDNILFASAFIILSFFISIVCSGLSYHYYEKPFLKLRKHLL